MRIRQLSFSNQQSRHQGKNEFIIKPAQSNLNDSTNKVTCLF